MATEFVRMGHPSPIDGEDYAVTAIIRAVGEALLAMFDAVNETGRPQVQTVLAGLPQRFFRVTVERIDPIPPEPIPESAIARGKPRRFNYPVGAMDA